MALRILYNSFDPTYKTPFGVLSPEEVCTVRLSIPCSCQATQVTIQIQQENGVPYCEAPLKLERTEVPYDHFCGSFSLPETGLFFYCFHIVTKNEQFRLFKLGEDTNMEAGDLWQLSCVDQRDPVPQEYWGRVFYQIFPDRFHKVGDCNCTDKLRPYWIHSDTHELPEYLPNAEGEVLNNDFYGGNLNGILEKLPYLHELGVGAIYLNPIFMAYSSHRYDTADYLRIDPMLGTDKDFAALCDAAHQLDIKIILDGVFSHTGSNSRYFDDQHLFGNGAISNPASPYRAWYQFQNYPTDYTSWWGFKTLPCLNKLEPSLMDFLFGRNDSVIAKWLRLGADGLRLDVVDELPDAFLSALRHRLRELNPRAFLIGEVWEDASNKIAYHVRRRYFTDSQLDSVMNYPWRKAILDFARGSDDGTALRLAVLTLAENYPFAVLNANLNLLSSHDVSRAITDLIDPSDADRPELARRMAATTPQQLTLGKSRFLLASFLQFTLPGCPCIYYGDEAGMTGYRDPFNRQYYPWGHEDHTLQAQIRAFAQLKNCNEALRRGTLTILHAKHGHFAFRRTCDTQSITLWCNASPLPWNASPTGTCLLGETKLPSLGFCAMLEN